MTLTTHALIAAALAKPLIHVHPIFAFIIAFASHFPADAIPHWDYRLRSVVSSDAPLEKRWKPSRKTLRDDFLRVALDGFLGALAIFAIRRPNTYEEIFWAISVIVGSMLPDFLQGVYFFLKRPAALTPLQKFHQWIHSKIRLGPYPLIGIPFQLMVAGIAIWFLI